jgi:hypothetical protein
MRSPLHPVFLAQRAYRRRRLTDAARLLPLAGCFLFLLPIFWRPQDTGVADTASGGLHLFAVWAVLIVAAAGVAAKLGRHESDDTPDRDDPHGSGMR